MIYERIREYCSGNNISLHELEKTCALGNGTIGKWKEGKIVPRLKTLAKISMVTGVSVNYWIGGDSHERV